MDLSKLSKVSGSLHRIEDMTRVGWLEPQKIEVCVYGDEPGSIPHFHVKTYRRGSVVKKSDIDCCVMFDESRYFSYGSHKDVLNSSLRKKLNEFMHSLHGDWGITNYEFAYKYWNDNTSDMIVQIKRDDKGNVIIPDYTNIKPYK